MWQTPLCSSATCHMVMLILFLLLVCIFLNIVSINNLKIIANKILEASGTLGDFFQLVQGMAE